MSYSNNIYNRGKGLLCYVDYLNQSVCADHKPALPPAVPVATCPCYSVVCVARFIKVVIRLFMSVFEFIVVAFIMHDVDCQVSVLVAFQHFTLFCFMRFCLCCQNKSGCAFVFIPCRGVCVCV